MPVSPFSRYKKLSYLEVNHPAKGKTRSLPIRRLPVVEAVPARQHRVTGFEGMDLLARRFYSREELYWHILDANGSRLPDEYEPGEMLAIPPSNTATRVDRQGR